MELQGQNQISLTGFDVKLPLQIAVLDASIGRISHLQGPPREGPESARYPSFHCEREIALSGHHGNT
jgi:hypothetical protein